MHHAVHHLRFHTLVAVVWTHIFRGKYPCIDEGDRIIKAAVVVIVLGPVILILPLEPFDVPTAALLAQIAEHVIKRAVLHHHDNKVLDFAKVARRGRRWLWTMVAATNWPAARWSFPNRVA